MVEPVLLEKPGIYTVVSDYRDTGGLLHIIEWVRKTYGLGGLYPTKIGICLNTFGWNNLKECMCTIDDKLSKQLKLKSGKSVTGTNQASLGNLLGNNAATTDSDSVTDTAVIVRAQCSTSVTLELPWWCAPLNDRSCDHAPAFPRVDTHVNFSA